ncbi:MAG TPA: hypothetical protein EYG91_06720 [Aquifex aeolicus]|nr:hypothetical protein [Aquifex aeolicus]
MAGRKIMKTFSIDNEIDEKLKKIPSRQSFLVNSLLKLFFEKCENQGIDWQVEIYRNPQELIKKFCSTNSGQISAETSHRKVAETRNIQDTSEKKESDIDIESFW